jgi:hypothetical protein
MPSRKEYQNASTRLQREMPISADTSLLELQQQAADFVRHSKRLHATESDDLVASVFDALARDYFRHVVRKKLRTARLSKARF